MQHLARRVMIPGSFDAEQRPAHASGDYCSIEHARQLQRRYGRPNTLTSLPAPAEQHDEDTGTCRSGALTVQLSVTGTLRMAQAAIHLSMHELQQQRVKSQHAWPACLQAAAAVAVALQQHCCRRRACGYQRRQAVRCGELPRGDLAGRFFTMQVQMSRWFQVDDGRACRDSAAGACDAATPPPQPARVVTGFQVLVHRIVPGGWRQGHVVTAPSGAAVQRASTATW